MNKTNSLGNIVDTKIISNHWFSIAFSLVFSLLFFLVFISDLSLINKFLLIGADTLCLSLFLAFEILTNDMEMKN